MGKLEKLLRRLAQGARLRDAWKVCGFPSCDEAVRALEVLAESLGSSGASGFFERGGEQVAPPGVPGSVDELIIYTDGASRGNPGPSAVAAVAYLPSGDLLTSVSKRIGNATNNAAEYRAVLAGLELARSLRAVKVVIRLDSELIVKQLNGQYRVRSNDLRPLAEAVLTETSHFEHCAFEHVPRRENTEADRLANGALDSLRGTV